MNNNKSAIILVGTSIECLFSLKKILDSGCLVSGVVFCNQSDLRSRIKGEYRRFRKYGAFLRFSQIFLSLIYKAIYGHSDKLYIKQCLQNFDSHSFYDELIKKNISYMHTSNYDSKESIDYIKLKDPDFLVCHTPYWIDKKVRMLPRDRLVIGGHPGLVPFYRGSHSAFWSIYDECPEKNGYSIFCLDQGVDSGPLIEQRPLRYNYNISYKSNDSYLMKYISLALAEIANDYSHGKILSVSPQSPLQPSQIRTPPGIIDFLAFKKKLRK
jgi:hypothetical protein